MILARQNAPATLQPGASMNKTTISEALRALAENKESEKQQLAASRSMTARVREVFGEIEAAQKAGVSLAEITETLNKQGFEIKLKTLETALYRIRHPRPRKTGGSAATPLNPTPTSPVQAAPIPESEAEDGGAMPEMDLIREALSSEKREEKMKQYTQPRRKLGVKQ
jgi:DNA-binding transcriptional MerR regulator